MCGITGIINLKNKLTRTHKVIVNNMNDTLVHRGPDETGVYLSKNHCFGHRRLSIIDIKHGHQPMISTCRNYSLVFNGEIYNYLELRQKLVQKGYSFNTHSDTEVLLNMLIEYDTKALDYLNGMFAFAFHNKQTNEYILARDHFGIKPLYYTCLQKDESLIFASEIKAIFKHPEISPEVNDKSIDEYLVFQFILGKETLFKNIDKIEPGYYLKITDTSKQLVRYWDIDYTIDYHHTEDYFRDELLSLLEDSTRLQVRSDVPVGAYLSGGLDSSVVSTMAANHLGTSINVFTGKFDESVEYDESHFAQILSKSIKANYNEIIPTAHDFVDTLPKLIYSLDEPVAGPGVFPQYFVSKLASEKVKVVLGGQGGDELFGGYARYLVGYLEQAIKGAIFETVDEEKNYLVTLESIIPNLPILQQYKPLMQHFWRDGLFAPMDQRYFRLVNRMPNIKNLLTPDYQGKFDKDSIYNKFQNVFNDPNTQSYVNKMTHFDMKTLLPALLQVEDRVSMSVSLESRVPLLDKRIVELISKMPPPIKFQGGRTKHIFKQAVKNRIPKEIFSRKDKMGFPVPLKEWFRENPVRDFVCDTLLSDTARQRSIFKTDVIEKVLLKEGIFGRQVWGLLCLELWFKRFIDNQ